jgi:hypothetical protein
VICTEQLEPGIKELTYCPKSCGKNFHYNCIQRWINERGKPKDFKCPHCRQPWPLKVNTALIHRFPKLDAMAFAMYNEWLYHHSITLQDDENGNPSLYNLVQAYFLGRDIQDTDFCGIVVKKLLETMKAFGIFPCAKTIKLAYEKSSSGCLIPEIMVYFYFVTGGSQWEDIIGGDDLPAAFWKDIASGLRSKAKMGNGEWDLEVAEKEFLYIWRTS